MRWGRCLLERGFGHVTSATNHRLALAFEFFALLTWERDQFPPLTSMLMDGNEKKTDTIFNECTISYRSSASICSYLLFLFVVLESASLFSPSHIHTQLHAFAFDFHPVKNNHFFSSTYIDCAVITKRFGIRKIFVDIPRKRRIL